MNQSILISFLSLFVYNLLISQNGTTDSPHYIDQANQLSCDVSLDFSNLFGNGVSVVDFDNDGLDDISLCSVQGEELYFYKNVGSKYELITPAFIFDTLESKQLIWVDFDNDGDQDIFLTRYQAHNKLFQNDGAFNFTDVTSMFNLPTTIQDSSFGANFGDINKDGWLDLYVTNYNPERNYLFLFDPVNQIFNDISFSSGTLNGNLDSFCSTFFDYDMDGDLDLYIANDVLGANTLYENNNDLTFTDVSMITASNININAMNTGVGDYNNDGYWDIYVTNRPLPGGCRMLENYQGELFFNVSSINGTEFNRYGWGGSFFDFDNDMDQDLYVTRTGTIASEPNALFVNDGSGNYSEPFYNSKGLGGIDTMNSHANVITDFDNNGLLDILNSHHLGEPLNLFINYGQHENNFFKVNLEGTQSNKDAFGALVEVWINGSKTIHQKFSCNAYLSQPSEYLNIGISTHNSVDSLVIHWPFVNSQQTILGNQIELSKMNHIVENDPIVQHSGLNVCLDDHITHLNPLPSQIYHGVNFLESDGSIQSGNEVHFQSTNEVRLEPGFETILGSLLEVTIDNCSN